MPTDAKVWSLQQQVDMSADAICSICFVSVWSCENLVFNRSVKLGF
jgi:hypothetical protein